MLFSKMMLSTLFARFCEVAFFVQVDFKNNAFNSLREIRLLILRGNFEAIQTFNSLREIPPFRLSVLYGPRLLSTLFARFAEA